MIILLHTSKTMKPKLGFQTSVPLFRQNAIELNTYLRTLNAQQISKTMKISAALADRVVSDIATWDAARDQTRAAEAFLGDIYSGLQVPSWDKADWGFADDHLRILSGLYGVLAPADGVSPYRLEMGYRLPDEPYRNLYDYWGQKIAKSLEGSDTILNLAAVEYSKVVFDYAHEQRIISPKFLTISPKTNQPVFVVVHAKIARGAFAHWVIKNQINEPAHLSHFGSLGYVFDPKMSTENEPVFICKKFGGIGLSIRLK